MGKYVGIFANKGQFVADDDAFCTMIAEIFKDEKLQQEAVEWFFSGNWIYEEDEENV